MAIRQLGETELFKLKVGENEQRAIGNVIRNKLNQNIGDIAPNQIELELTQLKAKSKNSFFPLLPDALALYETRGLVRLFNLGVSSAGRSPIPTYMPFLIAPARNRAKESNAEIDARAALDTAVFMNMYRIGNWSADESSYNGLSAMSDLYSCLESGVIMYRMLAQGMSERVFSNKVVVENLTKIYANMFAQAMVKTKVTFGGEDFKNDAAMFVIAKFFLKYVLKKTGDEIVGTYAMLAIKNRSSRTALESFEETAGIDYDTFSSFLKTFGLAFYNEPVFIMEFEDQWLKLFGEGTAFAVEYAPYLLHFLFAGYHGAVLGGVLRLTRRMDEYKKLGLPKLYAAVISEIK